MENHAQVLIVLIQRGLPYINMNAAEALQFTAATTWLSDQAKAQEAAAGATTPVAVEADSG
jgi:hypothetical protein